MTKSAAHMALLFALIGASQSSWSASNTEPLSYPPTQKIDHIDTYFGTSVSDPYHWLEDDNEPATKA
jgi:prolyl oligopeptidase